MNILLVGAGRMGLRHLRGLAENDGEIIVIDPRDDAKLEVLQVMRDHNIQCKIRFYKALDELSSYFGMIDAAILCSTANGRLEQFTYLAERGLKNILIEKPIEQSRQRFHQIVRCANTYEINAYCNFYRRTLPFFRELKKDMTPFRMTVSGGAFGLAVNGIHWIDFALYMANCDKGKLLWGVLDSTKIHSGRGTDFRDYGGMAVFEFENGSSLFINSTSDSSAPFLASIVQQTRHCIIDVKKDIAILYERPQDSAKPNYLYGADYARIEMKGIESVIFWDLTSQWIRSINKQDTCLLPLLQNSIMAHELLFDLLEISGETEFAIT